MKTTLVICCVQNESITMDAEIWSLQFKWTEVLYEVHYPQNSKYFNAFKEHYSFSELTQKNNMT